MDSYIFLKKNVIETQNGKNSFNSDEKIEENERKFNFKFSVRFSIIKNGFEIIFGQKHNIWVFVVLV